VLALALGALATQSRESTDEHYGYHDRDHYDHDRYYREGQSDGNYYRSRPPVDRRAFLNKCLSASWRFLRCAGIFRSSRCVRRFSPADYYPSAGADVMRSNAAPLFGRLAKVFGGLPVLPEERIIKTSILGDF
jgi:hypothetical protein